MNLIAQFINIFVVNIKQHVINDRSRARYALHSILIQLQKTYKHLNYNSVWTQAYFPRYDIVSNQ